MVGREVKIIYAALSAVFLFQACLSDPAEPDTPLGPNLNNPEILDLPKAPFELSAVDIRASRQNVASRKMSFELIFADSGWTHKDIQTELVVQPDDYSLNGNFGNEITVSVTSDSPDFQGVNIESSNEAVDVCWADDNRVSFRLKSCASGTALVSVWNGDRSNAISFPVHSNVVIPMTGVVVEYRGARYELKPFSESEFSKLSSRKLYTIKEWLGETEKTFETGVTFRVIGPVPINASEHNCLSILDEAIMLGGPSFDEIWSQNASMNPDFNWFTRLAGATPPIDLPIYPWELIGRNIVVFDKIGAETIKLKNRSPGSGGTAFALCIPFSKSTYDWIMSQGSI